MNSRRRIQEVICPPMSGSAIEAGYHGPEPVVLTPGACPGPGPAGQGRAPKRRLKHQSDR